MPVETISDTGFVAIAEMILGVAVTQIQADRHRMARVAIATCPRDRRLRRQASSQASRRTGGQRRDAERRSALVQTRFDGVFAAWVVWSEQQSEELERALLREAV